MNQEILFCKGGGCTAKLGPGALARILSLLPKQRDENLLIGFEGSDDAAVYRLTPDLALVQTLDFFPPMVEDPYLFGQIAAANALSDIYAMGGSVKTALNIVCFPEKMDLNLLGRILEGGSEKVREAGGILAGGHSITDESVKYGLSVTGLVHPDRLWANDRCQPGDLLLLTKPLGVGLVCTAQRLGAASPSAFRQAVRSMTALNKDAAQILHRYTVHSCTDVTGFGLLGHLREMLAGRYGARLFADAIPCLPESRHYAEEFYLTAAAQRNRNHLGDQVAFQVEDFPLEELLFDPQTSGGLLVSLPPQEGEAALEEIAALGLPCALIGEIIRENPGLIRVCPSR